MTFISFFYVGAFLCLRFAYADFVPPWVIPFNIVQPVPTEPVTDAIVDEEGMSSGNGLYDYESTTMPAPLTTNATFSTSSANSSTTVITTVDPKTVITETMKTKQEILKENRHRCQKLHAHRLKRTCEGIVENLLQDTDYLYVMTDDDDFKDLKQQLVDRGAIPWRRGFSNVPILPGDQDNCKNLKCPTTEDWLKGTLPHQRSRSPWTYCDNYDPDRIPAWIRVAKCNCNGCMDPTMEGQNLNYASKEIIRHIRVIRKDKSLKDFSSCGRSKLCQDSFEPVAVGCHCMVATIIS